MTLQHYLSQKLHASSIQTHLANIQSLKLFLGEEKTEQAVYQDIMEYIAALRNGKKKITTIQSHLQSIKHYYHYQIAIKKRKDHPCRYFLLKDLPRWNVQLQDLYNEKELEKLLTEPVHPKGISIRNQVIISLLVYQAMTKRELLNIELKDIDLEKATIFIRSTTTTNERTLSLKPTQIMLIYRYLNEEREKLLSRNTSIRQSAASSFILSYNGKSGQSVILHYLIKHIRTIFPDRKLTAYTIRQSVIANLLKQGRDIRVVQVFCGHKYPSTTEKYKQTHVEELKSQILKHHPLQ